MDPITEGLRGLDSLAKLVVCTIGLFCIPTLTRKYAQNLGLPAGQAIMSKAFYAASLAGIPAAKQMAGALSAGSKGMLLSTGRQALITGEKASRRLLNPHSSPSHPNLQSKLEDQAIKSKLMKEQGVTPWSKQDEKKLHRSNNPQEVKALAQRRQEALQFENTWSQMKSLATPSSHSSGSSNPSMRATESTMRNRSKPSRSLEGLLSTGGSPIKSQMSSRELHQPTSSGTQTRLVERDRNSSESSPVLKSNHQTLSRRAGKSAAGYSSRDPSHFQKPRAADLYARYQQIKKQKSWRKETK